MSKTEYGTVGWIDLTVENADEVRDFYARVAGWTPSPVSMGDYEDYTMNAADGTPAGGVCHARGANARQPPQWLIYINVEDLDASIANCLELGGEVVVPTRRMGGHGRYCVIRDPAGAVASLFEPA